jgi:hypothetical protein
MAELAIQPPPTSTGSEYVKERCRAERMRLEDGRQNARMGR